MKLYNSIYYSCPREESTHSIRKGVEWLEVCAKEQKNAIVLSIEELREMWKLAMQHGVRPYDTVSFEDFLISKGIKTI